MNYLSPQERKTIYLAAAKVHTAKYAGLYSPIPAVLHLYGENSRDMSKVLPELTMFDYRDIYEMEINEWDHLSGFDKEILRRDIEVIDLLFCAAMTDFKRV